MRQIFHWVDLFRKKPAGIRSYIPGTHQFRRARQIDILATAWFSYDQFWRLTVLEDHTKRLIWSAVRHYINWHAKYRVLLGFSISSIGQPVFILAALAAIVLSPIIVISGGQLILDPVFGTWLTGAFLNGVATLITFRYLFRPAFNHHRSIFFILSIGILLADYWVLLGGYTSMGFPIAISFAVATTLLSVGMLWFGCATVVVSYFFIDDSAKEYLVRKNPGSEIVTSLLEILRVCEDEPQPMKLESKQQVLAYLERVAHAIECYFQQSFKSGDAFTDVWQRDRAKQVANAVRAFKQGVIAPTTGTHGTFMKHMSESLIHVAEGNWGNLDHLTLENTSIVRTLPTQIITLGRILLSALLPIALIVLIQQTPLALSVPVADNAKVISILWAILSLLAALDPLLAAKLDALKDVTSLLPFTSKGIGGKP